MTSNPLLPTGTLHRRALGVDDNKFTPGNDGLRRRLQPASSGFAGAPFLASRVVPSAMNSAALVARFHRRNIVGALAQTVSKADLSAALGAQLVRG